MLIRRTGGQESGQHPWIIKPEIEILSLRSLDNEELAEVFAELAEGGRSFAEDAPGFMADGFEQPGGEGMVGFQADQVGGYFLDIVVWISCVEAAIVGGVHFQHGQEILAGCPIDDGGGGESRIAIEGKQGFPEGAGFFGDGDWHGDGEGIFTANGRESARIEK